MGLAKSFLDLRAGCRDPVDEAPARMMVAGRGQPLLADHEQPKPAAAARPQHDVEMLHLRQVVRMLDVDDWAVKEEDVAFFKHVGIGHIT